MRIYILLVAAFGVVAGQQYTTPVPILKQINKHNEDGSYSYGYESADGTYKIETKYPNGEVFGKYGYVDDQGQVRSVEYGASKRGFEPAGNEVQVPPPTLNSNNNYAQARPLAPNEEDDGQYREDPSVYYKNDPYASENQNQKYQQKYQQPAYQQPPYFQSQPNYYNSPSTTSRPAPAFRPQPNYNFVTSRPNYGFSSQQPNYYNPAPANPAYPNYNPFAGGPATNVDLYTGSYSVNYRK